MKAHDDVRRDVLLQLAALYRLTRAFGPDAVAVSNASAQLDHLVRRSTYDLGPVLEVRFENGVAYVDTASVDFSLEQMAAIRDLETGLSDMGLEGVTFHRSTPGQMLREWMHALSTGSQRWNDPRFQEAGIRGVPLPESARAAAEELRLLGSWREAAATVEESEGLPSSGGWPELAEDDLPLEPPEELYPSPVPTELPRPTLPPAPPMRRAVDSTRGALTVLVSAADILESSLGAAESGAFGQDHLTDLAQAGDEISSLVDERLDLAIQAHRVRSRSPHSIIEHGLHAASSALVSAIIGRGMELRGEARRTLARSALFAHLPFALAGLPPSPTRVPARDTIRYCERARSQTELPGWAAAEHPWWPAAWLVALDYRSPSMRPDGSRPHPAARLVSVASAYDVLVSTPIPPQKRGLGAKKALRTLARHADTLFDPVSVSVLTAVLAAYR